MASQENLVDQPSADGLTTENDLVSDIEQNVGSESEVKSTEVHRSTLVDCDNTRTNGAREEPYTPGVQDHTLPGNSGINGSKRNRRRKNKGSSKPSQPDTNVSLPNTLEEFVPEFDIDKLNEVFNVLRLVAPEVRGARERAGQNGSIEVCVASKKERKKNKRKEKRKSVEKQGSAEQKTGELCAETPEEKTQKENKKAVDNTAGNGNVLPETLQEQKNRSSSHQGEVKGIRKTKGRPKQIGEVANSSPSAKSSPKDKTKKARCDKPFEEHWPPEKLKEGLEKGLLIEGVVRINPKQFKDAYVSMKSQQDILIEGIFNRNRALEGDVVALLVNDSSEWKARGKHGGKESDDRETKIEDKKEAADEAETTDVKETSNGEETSEGDASPPVSPGGKLQRTAKVVGILSAEHSRTCVGSLKMMKDKSSTMALFSPRDSRVPRLRIFRKHTPSDFWKDPIAKSKTLYLAKITKWDNVMFALGEIIGVVGESASLQAETTALLLENDINITPYPASFSEHFPSASSSISPEEIAKRTDLRKECIFTIDPATAKDLDDAVSCKELENGNFEIGVHISDVTYFLQEGTPLDQEVAKRATSVYLVETVHHMLPLELCLLCSLSPGVDKLAYSVVWEITKDAEIVSQKIFRSVINSCAKLAYEHAQAMIENPDREWKPEEIPSVFNGFSVSDLNRTVNDLQKIAVQLRRKRFKDGALRIDQTKVYVSLDATGMPIAFQELVNTESNRLIEEFMLLANMTIAKFIFDKFPDVAFLRCHPEPHSFPLEQLKEAMEVLGIHLDTSSAGALQASLARYRGEDLLSRARMMVLNALCAKTMARAKYFCSSVFSEAEFWHYALSVPFYTHFTSPIRRYADVMVHRLLSAALDYCPKPNWNADFVQKIAANCNKQKYAAKLAGEQSIKLYLAIYVSLHQPVLEQAVVTDVKDHSFDVIVLRFGLPLRIYVNKVKDFDVKFMLGEKCSSLTLKWKASQQCPYETLQVIHIFSIVRVSICCAEDSVKMEATLVRPASVDTKIPS